MAARKKAEIIEDIMRNLEGPYLRNSDEYIKVKNSLPRLSKDEIKALDTVLSGKIRAFKSREGL